MNETEGDKPEQYRATVLHPSGKAAALAEGGEYHVLGHVLRNAAPHLETLLVGEQIVVVFSRVR